MDVEIYIDRAGDPRVNIGEASYRLSLAGGSPLGGRQAAGVFAGEYGETVRLFAEAWRTALPGIPPRFAWSGVVNSLGDHTDVGPNVVARERDYARPPERERAT